MNPSALDQLAPRLRASSAAACAAAAIRACSARRAWYCPFTAARWASAICSAESRCAISRSIRALASSASALAASASASFSSASFRFSAASSCRASIRIWV